MLCVPAWGEESEYTIRGFDPRIQQGVDLIYNLRFVEAERHFQAVIEAVPDNPLGYFFRASLRRTFFTPDRVKKSQLLFQHAIFFTPDGVKFS